MKFLVHAQTDPASDDHSPEAASHGYFFLMQAFSKTLAELGEVIPLEEASAADFIHAECASRGEACVLLSFALPHETPLGLACPVIPVFAWEYPDIPERIEEKSWQDDLRNDWRHVFAQVGKAITLSAYAAHAVKRAMGKDFPVQSIPLPLPHPEPPRQTRMAVASIGEGAVLRINAAIADSRCMGLNIDGLTCLEEEDGTLYKQDDEIILPRPNRPTERSCALVTSNPVEQEIQPLPEGESEPLPCSWDIPASMPIFTRLRGVVYTAILTPSAKHANWHDLITAFCWAFRDRDDATLLLKLSDDSLTHYHHELLMALTKMSPIKCRVIGIYGHLTESEQTNLRNITTYYVNASTHEGLCAPLMEFLRHGIPAISPDHTAMADYIDDELAFVVKSYPGIPAPWPHGDGELDRTSHYQLDWESLKTAFEQSHDVAHARPFHYTQMSRAAHSRMQAYCSTQTVLEQIRAFLGLQAVASMPARSSSASAAAAP